MENDKNEWKFLLFRAQYSPNADVRAEATSALKALGTMDYGRRR